ncbi:hypothetical protein GX50_03247 [[Emmonsia] crescens]|uniref:Uncharacterized protein n=1 Tax=[Emmonsia] crescens TaxID=73230 RepID=A0A2B7ZIX5_9EURO|nr:hypothetical protein GX50_03247 [Emmonsia crescens]
MGPRQATSPLRIQNYGRPTPNGVHITAHYVGGLPVRAKYGARQIGQNAARRVPETSQGKLTKMSRGSLKDLSRKYC